MKLLYKKLLTAINLFVQDLPDEDYRKLYRHIHAIQKYLEDKIRS